MFAFVRPVLRASGGTITALAIPGSGETLSSSVQITSASPGTGIGYGDSRSDRGRVERLVYADIARYIPTIVAVSGRFDMDPRTVVAIIYAEKLQYELDVMRRGKRHLQEFVETFPAFASDLYRWSQLTAGYTHIKESFARETKRRLDTVERHSDFLVERDVDPGFRHGRAYRQHCPRRG